MHFDGRSEGEGGREVGGIFYNCGYDFNLYINNRDIIFVCSFLRQH